MNATYLRIGLTMTALAAAFLSVACGGGTRNANTVQNANAQTAEAPKGLASEMNNACKAANKLDAVRQAVLDKIKGKGELHAQLNNGFSYTIDPGVNDSLKMTIRGFVGDYHNGAHTRDDDNFFDLIDILKKFARKGCISSIQFLPSGAAAGSGTTTDPGFIWFACEEPNIPCDGACVSPPCNRKKDEKEGESAGPKAENPSPGKVPNGNKDKKKP